MTVVAVKFELVKVSAIGVVEPEPVIGVIPATEARVHANVAPTVGDVKAIFVAVPEQMAEVATLLTIGAGLIVCDIFLTAPAQAPKFAVTA